MALKEPFSPPDILAFKRDTNKLYLRYLIKLL